MDAAFDGKLATVLETLGASGAEGEVVKLPSPDGVKAPLVLAVGLGQVPEKDAAFPRETLRRAAGAAARALHGTKKAAFGLPVDSPEDAQAVAEGALLGAYAFTAYQDRGRTRRAPWRRWRCSAASPATRRTRRLPSARSCWPRRSTGPATSSTPRRTT